MLKGGTALLSRIRSARHTLDIDVLHNSGADLDNAVAQLRDARYRCRRLLPLRRRRRLPDRRWRRHARRGAPGHRDRLLRPCRAVRAVRIDLVVTDHMTGPPDTITPTPVVDVAGLPQPAYRVYPVADHVADKVSATHQIYGAGNPSSRVRDLVDIVIIARTQHLDAAQLGAALTAKRLLHELPATETFTTPPQWEASFGKTAASVDLGEHATYPQALALARHLLDPVLAGTRGHGTWNPATLCWID